MNDAIAIFTESLTKSYGRFEALHGVNLDVRPGEIFGFLGPNRAGKTTAIRRLLDLIHPNGGTLRVLGLNPQKDPVQVRSHAGYLPGELHIEDNVTVESTLHYLNSPRGNKADWSYTQQLATKINLDLKTKVKNLSKDNKQNEGDVNANTWN